VTTVCCRHDVEDEKGGGVQNSILLREISKIVKIVAAICHILRLECIEIQAVRLPCDVQRAVGWCSLVMGKSICKAKPHYPRVLESMRKYVNVKAANTSH